MDMDWGHLVPHVELIPYKSAAPLTHIEHRKPPQACLRSTSVVKTKQRLPQPHRREKECLWSLLELPHPSPKPENHRSIANTITGFRAEAPSSWAFFEAAPIRISATAAMFLATPHREPFIVAHGPSEDATHGAVESACPAPLLVGGCPQPFMVRSVVRIQR
jgi:hypothetical protein